MVGGEVEVRMCRQGIGGKGEGCPGLCCERGLLLNI